MAALLPRGCSSTSSSGLGKPIFDSVSVMLCKALRMTGIEPRLDGWGCPLAGADLALTPPR
jgi:hypothetical protein